MGSVDIRFATLDADHFDVAAACTEDERDRAARFRSAEVSARWLRARAFVRTVLGTAVAADPATLRFDIGPHGKPHLVDGPVHFNMAHSARIVVVATAMFPIGIDVESPGRMARPDAVARRLFPTDTYRAWAALPTAEREPALLRRWTQTEAVLKATGEGFAGGAQGAVERLTVEGWVVRDFGVAGHAGSIAARGDDWVFRVGQR